MFLLLCACLQAAQRPRVVVMVTGGVGFSDISRPELPNIEKFLEDASCAVMAVRTGRLISNSKHYQNAEHPAVCVTLGAGLPAVADLNAALAKNANKSLERTILAGRGIVASEIDYITEMNRYGSYRAEPGLLGDMLHKYGIKTAVVGNSDTPEEVGREYVYVAADSSGTVDCGDVSSKELSVRSANHAFGMKANSEYIANRVREALREASFVVVECADNARADKYAHLCNPRRANMLRFSAIASLDELLAKIAPSLESTDYLVLLSTGASTFPTPDGNRVSWIAIRGPGYKGGLLSSPSTRRTGVVSVLDFAPTVLGMLDVPRAPQMAGRAVSDANYANHKATEYVADLEKRLNTEARRLAVMRGAAIVTTVVIALLTPALYFRKLRKVRQYSGWIGTALACVCLSLLIVPIFGNLGPLLTAFATAALVAAIMMVGRRLLKTPERLASVCAGLTLLVVAADLATGSRLLQSSPAGYSAAESARFYGIGNEIMGMVLGSAFFVLGLMDRMAQSDRAKVVLSTVFLGVVFLFIGMPVLGSNIGGALATVPAAAVYVLIVSGKRFNIKWLLPVLALAVLSVLGIFVVDYLRPSAQQSHAARLVLRLLSGGPGEVLSVVLRKLQVNLHLVRSSLWGKLLGISLLSIAMLWRRLANRTMVQFELRSQKAAAVALMAAVFGAFVFNDSGVVAASLCSIYLWLMLVFRMAEMKENGL